MTRTATYTIAIAALFLVAVSPAAADTRTAELLPAGPQSFPAWGVSQTNAEQSSETFMVRIDAAVKDGTTFTVSVILYGATDDDWIVVAKAPVRLGTALVAFDSQRDVSPVFPVDNVAGIRVSLRGKVILEGWFQR